MPMVLPSITTDDVNKSVNCGDEYNYTNGEMTFGLEGENSKYHMINNNQKRSYCALSFTIYFSLQK